MSFRFSYFGRSRAILVALLLPFYLTNLACSQEKNAGCSLEISVHDSLGNLILFEIVSIYEEVAGKRRDLLKVSDGGFFPVRARGTLIEIPESLVPSHELDLTLRLTDGTLINRRIAFDSCIQHISFTATYRDSGHDTGGISVRGKLFGCRSYKFFWVKMFPLFGYGLNENTFDGRVFSDGDFQVFGSMEGKRHLLVVGKESLPLLMRTVDVVAGKSMTLDSIPVYAYCDSTDNPK